MKTSKQAKQSVARLTLLCGIFLGLLSSCSSLAPEQESSNVWKPGVMDAERERRQAARKAESTKAAAEEPVGPAIEPERETQITRGPGVRRRMAMTDLEAEEVLPSLSGETIQVGYNNMPLPVFINMVFGEQLSLPYSLDPALAKKNDLVTLRLTQPVTPQELFRIARRTLMDYGVALRQDEGVFVFYIDQNVTESGTPLLVSGRALPDVPDSHRTMFMFVPLEVVPPRQVRGWLIEALKGRDIEISSDPTTNSIMLKGKTALVNQALAMIKLLDQPQMRGKYSMSIEPVFVEVDVLATDLESILKSEGYEASTKPPKGTVILLPLKGNNQLVVFAASQEVLDHVEQWVRQIDRRQELSIKNGVFTYKVRNTYAGYLVELLNQLEDSGEESSGQTGPAGGGQEGGGAAAVADVGRAASGSGSRGGQFVVDTNRNAIIFRGSGQEWAELMPVLKEMDHGSPSVLIEVLLAEISLNDAESTSFEFLAKSGIGNYDAAYGTLGLLTGDGTNSAFRAVFDKRGETRAILSLLYENSRAEIRSRPRLMAKSGQTASIDVGDEVPIVTTSSQTVTDPGAPLVQNIVYRNTGVRLEIRPIVHNSGVVDVEVTQELSEAQINETSGIDSPTIRNRTVRTTVTLRDGGSILLGGLISTTSSTVDKGVPILGKIPGLGRLFSAKGEVSDRRELIMLITPYVVDTPEDAQDLTDLFTAEGTF